MGRGRGMGKGIRAGQGENQKSERELERERDGEGVGRWRAISRGGGIWRGIRKGGRNQPLPRMRTDSLRRLILSGHIAPHRPPRPLWSCTCFLLAPLILGASGDKVMEPPASQQVPASSQPPPTHICQAVTGWSPRHGLPTAKASPQSLRPSSPSVSSRPQGPHHSQAKRLLRFLFLAPQASAVPAWAPASQPGLCAHLAQAPNSRKWGSSFLRTSPLSLRD